MELLQKDLVFSSDGGTKWRCQLLRMNFKKLLPAFSSAVNGGNIGGELHLEHAVFDMLHAVVGVFSVSLPDMEIPAIYSTLATSNCNTLVIVTSVEDVVCHRSLVGCPKPVPIPAQDICGGNFEVTNAKEDENPFSSIISDGEDSDDNEDNENTDVFDSERKSFLKAAALRRSLSDQLAHSSVGAEHCVLGCAAFSHISTIAAETKPIQLSLLAVRKSCRKMGIGRCLMQNIKDPEVVGCYNALLAFADPKAEDFFTRHGFSEDPILSARYQPFLEHWENSTLMIYTPPFSDSGLAVGSLKSLAHFQEHYKEWRESAITGYSVQLGVMERLRHELFMLHSKVQAQDEMIEVLSKELKQAKQANQLLEQEFQQYRKRSQRLLCDATVQGAQEWINTTK